MKLKKITLSLSKALLSFGIVASLVLPYDFIDVVLYENNIPFTSMSPVEAIYLEMDCDAITLQATCEGNETDSLLCEIIDCSNGGYYSDSIPFIADGSFTTTPQYFPEGLYKVVISGSPNITKDSSFVLFTQVKFHS